MSKYSVSLTLTHSALFETKKSSILKIRKKFCIKKLGCPNPRVFVVFTIFLKIWAPFRGMLSITLLADLGNFGVNKVRFETSCFWFNAFTTYIYRRDNPVLVYQYGKKWPEFDLCKYYRIRTIKLCTVVGARTLRITNHYRHGTYIHTWIHYACNIFCPFLGHANISSETMTQPMINHPCLKVNLERYLSGYKVSISVRGGFEIHQFFSRFLFNSWRLLDVDGLASILEWNFRGSPNFNKKNAIQVWVFRTRGSR